MEQHQISAEDTARRPVSREQAEDLVVATITRHAESVLRLARRHSICADDAQDAYQRALEIFLRHAHRLDPDRAGAWLHTVAKHEAMAVRRARGRTIGTEEVDFDTFEARTCESPEERVLSFEHLTRSAEALQRLKPNEVRALWLKAAGNSYAEICEQTGWTYTKVNRCLAEGRKRFLERYAGIETGEECLRWQPILSAIVDGEATGQQLIDVRPHLRNCGPCRATLRQLHSAGTGLSAVLPASVVATTATDHLEPATNFLTRLWESISLTFQERAASTVMRTQALVETATANKTAAVAASAIAVAGGGLAAKDETPIKSPAPIVQQIPRASATPAVRPTVVETRALSQPASSPPPKSRGTSKAIPGPRASASANSRSSVTRREEPLIAPVEGTRGRSSLVPQAPATGADAASARSGPAGAAGEFGFERP